MTDEQRKYYEEKLARIRRGGYDHELWVQKSIGGYGNENLGPVDPPVVGMANSSDGFYCQWFQNREQVEEFIAQLRAAADEAWPASVPHIDGSAMSVGCTPLKWVSGLSVDQVPGGAYANFPRIPGLRVDPVTGNIGIGEKK